MQPSLIVFQHQGQRFEHLGLDGIHFGTELLHRFWQIVGLAPLVEINIFIVFSDSNDIVQPQASKRKIHLLQDADRRERFLLFLLCSQSSAKVVQDHREGLCRLYAVDFGDLGGIDT